ncbi:lytic transglycosylase domain-containing protein, partial [Acidithiobacillus sp. MC2.1]
VVRVENGGDFHGAATRVSSAGAIGVMQLEPATAWDTLRVNPWNPRQNIEGGARFLALLLREFGGNVRLALMAYNAGPTWIAQGGRPEQAVIYANEVLAYAYA